MTITTDTKGSDTMKKVIYVILPLFLLLVLVFLSSRNDGTALASMASSQSVHQGDLYLSGGNVTTVEGRLDINGSIIIEGNATLVLREAVLNFTQRERNEFNITLRNPGGGNPRLEVYDSTLTSNFRVNVFLQENSTAEVHNSTSSPAAYQLYGQSLLSMYQDSFIYNIFLTENGSVEGRDSVVREIHVYDSSRLHVINTEIQSFLIGPSRVNCTLSDIGPGHVDNWNFLQNSSTVVLPGGTSPNVTLMDADVKSWRFVFYSRCNAKILDSDLGEVSATSGAFVHVGSSKCSMINAQPSARLYAYDCALDYIEAGGSSIRLVNSTYSSNTYFYSSGEFFVGWYADVQVLDSSGQEVPSANVTATYQNGSVAGSGLSNAQGLVRLILIEKRVNESGDMPIGNYTLRGTDGSYFGQTTVDMTENRLVTLPLIHIEIPEISSMSMATIFVCVVIFLLPRQIREPKPEEERTLYTSMAVG